nr:DinB family protein [uncultured Allomuricauda sp.]
MKKTLLILLVTMGTSNVLTAQDKALDKTLALDLLHRTWEELEKTVSSLQDTDLNYTPKSGGWSVMNNLEHLTLVEPVLIMEIKKIIDGNALDTNKDLSSEDGLIITQITDRTRKVDTPKPFKPMQKNKHKSKDDFLQEIKSTRMDLIALLENTEADLRHLFGPYPYGEADAYQQFIIAAAHSYRHVMQIQEVLNELKPDKKAK